VLAVISDAMPENSRFIAQHSSSRTEFVGVAPYLKRVLLGLRDDIGPGSA
jgi:hypothetical protein